MADPPAPEQPSSPPIPPAGIAALVIFGLALGAGLTLYVLRPQAEVLPAAAPAPSPPPPLQAALSGEELRQAWSRVRREVDRLRDEADAGDWAAAAPGVREQFPSPEAWAKTRSVLRDRLAPMPAEPPTPGSPFQLQTRHGDQGEQDILTATSTDGGALLLFFEQERLVSVSLDPTQR